MLRDARLPARGSRYRAAARDLPPIAAFVALGAHFGAWVALLPGIARHTDTSESALGLCMLAASLAALVAMRGAGRASDRWGALALPAALATFATALVWVAAVPTTALLALAMTATSFAATFLNVAMNTEMNALEDHGVQRMPLAHAGFSAGMLGSSVATSIALGAGLGALDILGTIAVLVGCVAVASHCTRSLRARPAAAPQAVEGQRPRGPIDPRIAALGVIALLALAVEAGTNVWSAMHLQVTLGASPQFAALAPACFAVAMVAARLWLQASGTDRDPYLTIAWGAGLGAAGVALFALAATPWMGLAACVVSGAGLAVLSPTIMSTAGRLGGAHGRGAAVGTVSAIAWFGGVIAQTGTGFVADAVGLRAALLTVSGVGVLTVFAALAAGAAARRQAVARRERPAPAVFAGSR